MTAPEVRRIIESVYRNKNNVFNSKPYKPKSEYIAKNIGSNGTLPKKELKEYNTENEVTKIPPFPIEAFPVEIQYFITELYAKKAIPIDYTCGAILAAFSTAIGKKFSLKHDNYYNYAGLWIAIVGNSGTNKTEPMRICFEPLKNHDSKLYETYLNQLEEFENYEASNKREQKNLTKVSAPLFKSYVLDDVTIEALYECLYANDSGLCLHQEELIGFIMDLERYGNKSTITKFLSFWSNITFSYVRKLKKQRIEKPFVNIAGGIQPDLLKTLAGANRSKDGTINRFLYCYPDRVNQGKPTGVLDESILENYSQYIIKLLNFEFDLWPDSMKLTKSHLIYLNKEASIIFDSFNDQLRAKINSLPECSERQFISKLQLYLYRISLLLHLIEFSVSDLQAPPPMINGETMKGVVKIIKYFLLNSEKISNEIGADNGLTEKNLLIELRLRTGRSYTEILEFLKSNVKEDLFRKWISLLSTTKI
jgi:hypothetical protein